LSAEDLRASVLGVVQDSSGLLAEGEWELRGSELVVRVAASQTVAELALSAEARRSATQAVSAAAGRPLKLRLIGGAANGTARSSAAGGNGGAGQATRPGIENGARARASEDPVVRRMQEKFGAEIRTIIDYKEKR
jgi:DNA polymerase-3 subunit gamma/tau